MSETNGHNKAFWWLTGALIMPLVLATFGKIMHTTFENSARTAALEAEIRDRTYRMERIEKKLDAILNHLWIPPPKADK